MDSYQKLGGIKQLKKQKGRVKNMTA